MVRKRFERKKGAMALSQVLVLLIGTVAIAYALGGQIGGVSAAGTSPTGCTGPSGNAISGYPGYFCYGDSNYGYDVYQVSSDGNTVYGVTGPNTGTVYTRNSAGEWATSGTVLSSSTGDSQTNFNAGATAAYQALQSASQNSGSSTSGVPTKVSDTTSMTNCLEYFTQTQCAAYYSPGNGPAAPTSSTTPPVTSGVPSGAGSTLLQSCINLFGNSGTDFMNCINGITSTASSLSAAGNLAKKAANVGKFPKPTWVNTPGGEALGSGAGSVSNWVGWGILKNVGEIAGAAAVAWGIHQGFDYLISLIPNINQHLQGEAALQLGNALLSGASVGATLGLESVLMGGSVPTVFGLTGVGAGLAWSGIGAAVALALYFTLYKQHNSMAVQFSCIPWQAPLGGSECGTCGENGLPCTVYECASLGQNCMLLNSGTTGKQVCTEINVNNNPPVMTFMRGILPSGYSDSPLGAAVLSSTGDTGVLVTANTADGKVPPYTSLTLGVHTDKPSVCAYSPLRIPITDSSGNDTFSKLSLMDAGLYLYNHTLQIPQTVNSPTGDIELYVRCHDANDPSDYAPNYFIIKFGMQPVTDHSNPVVLGTNYPSGATVPYGVTSMDASIYVSKAVSECRWSHTIQSYSDMINKLDCSQTSAIQNGIYYSVSDGTQQSAVGTYSCIANLTGIQKNQNNDYYFRCNDTLGDVNNANPPASFSIKGSSQALAITSASPNNTVITGGSDSIKVNLDVQTAGGSDGAGTANCYYNDTVNTNTYKKFTTTNSYESTNPLWLPAGDYSFPIRCSDAAGDSAFTTLNFSVFSDTTPPGIVRVYKDSSNLDVVTNENATCVYDTNNCLFPFSSGTSMTDLSNTIHAAPWVTDRTYYIKCQDTYGNKPAGPDECTSIVQASSL